MFSGLLQPMHLLLILGVVLIVFGPGKLGNLGHDLGKSLRDFKAAMNEHNVTPHDETAAIKAAQPEATTATTMTASKTEA